MSEDSYAPYIEDREEMILRDYLAVDRTILANENSFMSYIRTALTLIAVGVSLIKFFDNPIMAVLGWVFVSVGGWLAAYGLNRYRRVDNVLHRIKGEYIEKSRKVSRGKGWVSVALRALHIR
jgi:putative membrane protein